LDGATARRHHPNPAEAHWRWRGKRSEPIRLGVRDHHTRSLCAQSPAQSDQWCCWFARRRSIFGSAESRPIRALQRCRSMAKHRRRTLAEDSGSTRPERHFPSGAVQTRIVSVATIRLDSRKSVRSFKGIICGHLVPPGALQSQRERQRASSRYERVSTASRLERCFLWMVLLSTESPGTPRGFLWASMSRHVARPLGTAIAPCSPFQQSNA
jgi:hypothetical protein